MKRLIVFLKFVCLLLVFTSCEKDDSKMILDPLATFSLKPDAGAFALRSEGPSLRSTTTEHLSALEIVKQTTIIRLTYNSVEGTRMFDALQRDTTSAVPCLKMWATDIINMDGNYVPDFIEAENCILEHFGPGDFWTAKKDTIGYIPNSVLRAAEVAIKEAYNANDTERVYKVFNEAFTFRPITGSEYRALMAEGIN